jgi:4-hydroxy-3-methylbut-2-enyl diphosphate reductase
MAESQVDRVLLCAPRGFCAGVEMAIKALAWMVRAFEPPVYCYHEIVHNKLVVDRFRDRGVVFVDDIEDVPPGRPIMLSAHGSAPDVVTAARERGSYVVDAVCPLVTKVHHEAKVRASKGYTILYVGHEGHDEALGAVAQAPEAVTLVDPEDGLGDFAPADPSKVALLAQTTLGMYEWEGVLDDARDQFADVHTSRKSDLCYATTNRQRAVEELSKEATLILVVGSENSSNTQALVRVARNCGVTAYRIDGADDVDDAWLEGHDVIGVTAGASAPDQRVQSVVRRLGSVDGAEVLRVTQEDEYFPLPPALRKLIHALQAVVEAGYACRNPGLPGPVDQDRDWGATEALELLGG